MDPEFQLALFLFLIVPLVFWYSNYIISPFSLQNLLYTLLFIQIHNLFLLIIDINIYIYTYIQTDIYIYS